MWKLIQEKAQSYDQQLSLLEEKIDEEVRNKYEQLLAEARSTEPSSVVNNECVTKEQRASWEKNAKDNHQDYVLPLLKASLSLTGLSTVASPQRERATTTSDRPIQHQPQQYHQQSYYQPYHFANINSLQ